MKRKYVWIASAEYKAAIKSAGRLHIMENQLFGDELEIKKIINNF